MEFDATTLETAGVAFTSPGELTTAHPHGERGTGAMLNYAAKLGPRSSYRFFRVAPDGARPQVVAKLGVREPAYMHSFGLTERYFVLAEFPLVVHPLRLATSGRPYIENFRWKPELGTRFTLIDRTTGRPAGEPMVADSCFAFHHVNAYDDGDEVVCDISVYPDAGLIEDLYLDRLRAGKPIPAPELRRFRLRPAQGDVETERLTELGIELARINYGRCNGRPYRYAWGVATQSGWNDTIAKADVHGRTTLEWREADTWPGEPVFVARPGAEAEDDGVLLSVVLDGATDRSFLLVLDARDMTELARAQVPHHIPFSFHGQFARA